MQYESYLVSDVWKWNLLLLNSSFLTCFFFYNAFKRCSNLLQFFLICCIKRKQVPKLGLYKHGKNEKVKWKNMYRSEATVFCLSLFAFFRTQQEWRRSVVTQFLQQNRPVTLRTLAANLGAPNTSHNKLNYLIILCQLYTISSLTPEYWLFSITFQIHNKNTF